MTVTNIFWRCGLLHEYMHASKTLKKKHFTLILSLKRKNNLIIFENVGGGLCYKLKMI